MLTRCLSVVVLSVLLVSPALGAGLRWHNNYKKAYQEAKLKRRLLLILFPGKSGHYRPPPQLGRRLRDFVLLRVPASATIPDGKKQKPLQSHDCFAPLQKGPGMALVNLKYEDKAYGHVVKTLGLSKATDSPVRVLQLLEETDRKFGPDVLADEFGLKWHTEYDKAYKKAKKEKKLLLTAFDRDGVRFSPQAATAKRLRDFVLVRLYVAESDALLSRVAFRHLHRGPGICVVNLKHDDKDYERVVQVLPAEYMTADGITALLDLADRRTKLPQLRWLDDYHQARAAAAEQKKMLLIAIDSEDKAFSPEPKSVPALHAYVLLRQTTESRYEFEGEQQKLLNYGDFQPMREKAGLVVYDFKHQDALCYEEVVSVMPYKYLGPKPGNRTVSEEQREYELLILEPGTLSQRTLTWAIRVSKGYGENQRLRSADGQPCTILRRWALKNSRLQCSYGCGHHAGGPMRSEIASPGPGQDIVDGALNMVRIWRSSPPHYSAMVRYHRRFGYDMFASSRQHWYGTGRF